jgi:autotransporter-associated beta strand protein
MKTSVVTITLLLLSLSSASSIPEIPIVFRWIGSQDGYWSNPDNWVPSGRPRYIDTVLFPDNAVRRICTNDLTAHVAELRFAGSGFAIHGRTTLHEGITVGSGWTLNTIHGGISLAENVLIQTTGTGRQLTLEGGISLNGYGLLFVISDSVMCSGVISGEGSVTKTGPGRLIFGGIGANSYSGSTTVSQGTLELSKYLLLQPGDLRSGRVAVPGQLTI